MAIQLTNPMNGDVFKAELEKALDKTGDTMTGDLLLKGDPTKDNEAATKKYVDKSFWFVPGDYKIFSQRKSDSSNYDSKVYYNVGDTHIKTLFKTIPRNNGEIRLVLNFSDNSCPFAFGKEYAFDGSDPHSLIDTGKVDVQIVCKSNGTETILYEAKDITTEFYDKYRSSSLSPINNLVIPQLSRDIPVTKDETVEIELRVCLKEIKRVLYRNLDYTSKYSEETPTDVYFRCGRNTRTIEFSMGNPMLLIEEVE